MIKDLGLATSDELPKEAQNNYPGNPDEGAFTQTINKVPLLGGLINTLGGGAIRGAETTAEGFISPAVDLATEGQFTNKRRFMSANDYDAIANALTATQAIGNTIPIAAKAAANVGAFMVPLSPSAQLATKAPLIGPILGNLPGILPTTANLAASGGAVGGLQAFSQRSATPNSVLAGTIAGAVTNPLLYGTGKLITDVLPRYLGFRAYGQAGKSLPEVVKARKEAGDLSLKEVRDMALSQSKGTVKKQEVVDMIEDLAKQDQWIGTPGLKETVRRGNRVVETGALSDIKAAFRQSEDLPDFYFRLKNMAYPVSDSPASGRLAGFMRSAASNVREYLISHSDDPELVRNAMDLYAAETAMNRGTAIASNGGLRQLNDVIAGSPSQVGEAGLAGLLSVLPGLQGLAPIALADAALTNRYVGPRIASKLVNASESNTMNILAPLLQRLGVNLAGRIGG